MQIENYCENNYLNISDNTLKLGGEIFWHHAKRFISPLHHVYLLKSIIINIQKKSDLWMLYFPQKWNFASLIILVWNTNHDYK